MYKYCLPKPILINLTGEEGFELRKKAAEFVKNIKVKNIEAGSEEEQTYGVLAEMIIRNELNLPELNLDNREFGWDIKLPLGVKLDIKCRGGTKPFQEEYEGSGGLNREALRKGKDLFEQAIIFGRDKFGMIDLMQIYT